MLPGSLEKLPESPVAACLEGGLSSHGGWFGIFPSSEYSLLLVFLRGGAVPVVPRKGRVHVCARVCMYRVSIPCTCAHSLPSHWARVLVSSAPDLSSQRSSHSPPKTLYTLRDGYSFPGLVSSTRGRVSWRCAVLWDPWAFFPPAHLALCSGVRRASDAM